jgi:hypothetical protein
MTEEEKFNVGKPPVFDGNNYDYGIEEWRFASRPWEEICGEL